MEQQKWATQEIRAAGHTCWSYPINYADIHLEDVCLYNFGSILRRLKPATYNKLCTQIDKVQKGPPPPPTPVHLFFQASICDGRRLQAIEAISSCCPFPVNKPCLPNPHQAICLPTLTPKPPPIPSPLSLMLSISQAQMKAIVEQLVFLLVCSKLQIDVSLANVLYLILCQSTTDYNRIDMPFPKEQAL
ncbi:hypothetical protein DSO57_1014358 [Entomophthora muscae]|uniref:Uncharacterized protein n=1 Tax=Entomophthora muscae TaxID=34485 RepID=A0ACC2U3N7_9FUNG|nr:hypothetical protein DSO57_1014358 [Entomophthora muscae]